jgi:lipopolysaccharide biosynthesis glycosyltransferase
MLIDLARWRRDDLTARVLDFARTHAGQLAFPDQDALNCVLDGGFLPLEPRWNLTRPMAERGCADPRIAHFTGTKPWSVACRHPARDLFLRHRAATPWRNARLMTRFETRMARSLRKRQVGLRRLFARLSGPPAAPQ